MFEFTHSSCVVVGTFNIYIIQPQWLVEVGIIPEGESVKMQADFRNPGFRFRELNSPLEWSVRPDRIQIQSRESGSDCGEPLSKVLSHLHWTPIIAVGSNLTFKAPVDDLDRLLYLFGTGPDPTLDDYSITQKTWHRALKREAAVFNLQLSAQEEYIELNLNAHTEVKNERSIRSSNELARETCESFFEQRMESVSLANSWIDDLEISL